MAGGNGDSLSVTMAFKMPGTYDDAIITVTCGTASVELTVVLT